MFFEYIGARYSIKDVTEGKHLPQMQYLGSVGWELVTFIYEPHLGSYYAMFKRPYDEK